MARETKVITVAPANEQYNIEVFQNFGWELMSTQEIYNAYSGLHVNSKGEIGNDGDKTNYVKLAFTRNTEMRNYHQLVALEKQFWSVSTPTRTVFPIFIPILGIIVALLPYILNALRLIEKVSSVTLIIGIIIFVLGIVCKIISSKRYDKKLRATAAEKARIRNEAAQLL